MLPDIKVDADSRNIEELKIEPDPERFNPSKSDEEMKALEDDGLTFSDYEGMMPEMKAGSLVIDDISQYETDMLIEISSRIFSVPASRKNIRCRSMGFP